MDWTDDLITEQKIEVLVYSLFISYKGQLIEYR